MAYIENNTCIVAPAARPTVSLRQLYNVWRSRRALATLDEAALNDVGLNRAQAEKEAARPFWDAPQSWRK